MTRYVFAILLQWCVLQAAVAAPGDLDTSFGNGGWISLASRQSAFASLYAEDAVMQTDGKLLVAGEVRGMGRTDAFLFRYLPDGSLDATFGVGGRLVESLDQQDMENHAVVQLPDGKIFVAANRDAPNDSVIILSRYQTNGVLDAGFGDGGRALIQSLPAGYTFFSIRDLAVQSAGKLLLFVRLQDESYAQQEAVVRFNADGSIDTSFAAGGWLLTGASSRYLVDPHLLVQADQKIVIGLTDDERRFVLLRYLANGDADTGFGDQGRVVTAVGHTAIADYKHAELAGVQQQPDGKLLVNGTACNGDAEGFYCDADAVVLRFDGQGVLDHDGFGVAGVAWSNQEGLWDFGEAVFQNPDGSVDLSGVVYDGDEQKRFSLRFQPDGVLKKSFGKNGVMMSHMPVRAEEHIFLRGNGRKTVLVYNLYRERDGVSMIGQQRILPDGDRDDGFGNRGVVNTIQHMRWIEADRIFADADGGFSVTAFVAERDGGSQQLVRLTADGKPDKSFRRDGFWRLPPGQRIAAKQADGKWLATGMQGGQTAIYRYTAGGKVDRSFGARGTALVPALDEKPMYLEKLLVQPDGKLLLAVSHRPSSNEINIWLFRLLPDGLPDISFGEQGSVLLAGDRSFLTALQLDGFGNILAGVGRYSAGSWQSFLQRYQADGAVDDAFGTAGSVSGGSLTGFVDLLAAAEGTLFLASEDGTGFVVGALQPDGSADAGFADQGLARVTRADGQRVLPRSLHRLPSGQLLVSGTFYDPQTGFTSAFFSRLSAAGNLDTTFGDNGWQVFNAANGDKVLATQPSLGGVTLLPDGNWLLPFLLEDGRLHVARFLGSD